MRLVGHAQGEQDAALFLTDEGGEDLPKSYRVRPVPLMPQVALALTNLRMRDFFTEDDELVFVNEVGGVRGYDALSRRYRAAQGRAALRPLRFHDLRHSFGTMAVRQFRSQTCRPGWATPTSPPHAVHPLRGPARGGREARALARG